MRGEIELGHFLFSLAPLNNVKVHRGTAKGPETLVCVLSSHPHKSHSE